MTPKPLRIAITIFPEAMALDWVGPLDILNTLSRPETKPPTIPAVECIIVGDSISPIKMSNGMQVTPELTYEVAQNQEWDAVLVPGGMGARPWFESNARCREFLVEVVPKCRYVFTGMYSCVVGSHQRFKEVQDD
jgi:transcriptional regulator GlxA family with amidase domain